jgi:hypothetical protein
MPVFHVEMLWRCGGCNHENLGRYKQCQRCGKPKQGEPFYDAPGSEDPTQADAVTDAALIQQATAGADWRCNFCGSHQRRDSGECAQCGAGQVHALQRGAPAARAARAVDASASKSGPWQPPRWVAVLAIVGSVLLGLGWLLFRTWTVDAVVAERTWTQSIEVERYQVTNEEGFTPASDAFDQRSLGERHHHDEQVQDGYETESYTESEACGEDCSTTPVSCTVNDNGFKTCSGGDRVCSTRYCSVNKTRQVPKYKAVPVYETYYAWKAWRWLHHRSIADRGSGDDEPSWPDDARVALGAGCTGGEKERASRRGSYTLVLRADDDRHEVVLDSAEAFARHPIGAKRKLELGFASEPRLVEP